MASLNPSVIEFFRQNTDLSLAYTEYPIPVEQVGIEFTFPKNLWNSMKDYATSNGATCVDHMSVWSLCEPGLGIVGYYLELPDYEQDTIRVISMFEAPSYSVDTRGPYTFTVNLRTNQVILDHSVIPSIYYPWNRFPVGAEVVLPSEKDRVEDAEVLAEALDRGTTEATDHFLPMVNKNGRPVPIQPRKKLTKKQIKARQKKRDRHKAARQRKRRIKSHESKWRLTDYDGGY